MISCWYKCGRSVGNFCSRLNMPLYDVDLFWSGAQNERTIEQSCTFVVTLTLWLQSKWLYTKRKPTNDRHAVTRAYARSRHNTKNYLERFEWAFWVAFFFCFVSLFFQPLLHCYYYRCTTLFLPPYILLLPFSLWTI